MSRQKKLISFGLVLVLLAGLLPGAGCALEEVKQEVKREVKQAAYAKPAASVDGRLVEGNTSFGLKLFKAILEASPGENIFISPASVSLALAMTKNGAAGETRAAMAQALQLEAMSLDEANAAFADLRSILLNPDPKVELSIANSLWARQGVAFHEDFLERNRKYFGAQVTELDFDHPDATKTINAWVKEQTKGKIEKIVEPPIHPLTVLFLINAIYFKGAWSEAFNPELTRELPFTLADGGSRSHPMMFKGGEFRYLDGEGFQAVALPYGENERISMYIFLPDRDSSLKEFYHNLTPENWAQWRASFRTVEGEVGLPRFKFSYEASLNDYLKALGMGVAFDMAAADFSGMRPIPPQLFIADVKHKTYVDVNEKGTEAAAVTSVEMRVTSMPLDRLSMIADRPFCFAIVDDQTGSLLFIGALTDPGL
jgi:serpin B